MKNNKKQKFSNNKTYKNPFIDFGTVNSRTAITKLNYNWSERDLPEKERTKHVHRLHPYLGKFIPQLPEIFLRKYKPKCILDPFCGSGTTLVQASELGVDSIGVDISEFNCLISKVKTNVYDINKLENEVTIMRGHLKQINDSLVNNQLNLLEDDIKLETFQNEYLQKWFAPECLAGLLAFKKGISKVTYKNFFNLVLSRAARSSRLVKHYDLEFPKQPQTKPYYCRKHSRICKPTTDSIKFLNRYLLDGFRRVKEFNLKRINCSQKIIHEDSRTINFGEFDMVFTSPPYVGLINYHEQHRYSYELLNLKMRQEDEIGISSLGKGQNAKDIYREMIYQVYSNISNQIKPGGKVITVINDAYDLLHSEELGFKETFRIKRHVNRRTGRRNKDFYESILIWKKN